MNREREIERYEGRHGGKNRGREREEEREKEAVMASEREGEVVRKKKKR